VTEMFKENEIEYVKKNLEYTKYQLEYINSHPCITENEIEYIKNNLEYIKCQLEYINSQSCIQDERRGLYSGYIMQELIAAMYQRDIIDFHLDNFTGIITVCLDKCCNIREGTIDIEAVKRVCREELDKLFDTKDPNKYL
jgi:hypothetical protein